MTLFYYRFSVDIILGALVVAYLAFVIVHSFFSEKLGEYQNFIFYLSLPASNVTATRSILTLSVAIERLIAVFAPIFFHKYRQHCPNFAILVVAVAFGLAEDVVLYGPCQFHLDIPKNCAALGCAINLCFLSYWSTSGVLLLEYRLMIFALTFALAIFLCVKLFILNKVGKKESIKLSRTNRLALIDAATVCTFNFLPSIISNQFSNIQFFSFQNIGPYGSVTKAVGYAIQAFLVFQTLKRDEEMTTSENSKSILKKGNNLKLTEVKI